MATGSITYYYAGLRITKKRLATAVVREEIKTVLAETVSSSFRLDV
jgi:hypothetical protein